MNNSTIYYVDDGNDFYGIFDENKNIIVAWCSDEMEFDFERFLPIFSVCGIKVIFLRDIDQEMVDKLELHMNG